MALDIGNTVWVIIACLVYIVWPKKRKCWTGVIFCVFLVFFEELNKLKSVENSNSNNPFPVAVLFP